MISRWAAPTRLTWIAAAFALCAWMMTTAFLAVIYPRLPFGLPVRYVDNVPLIYQVKTPSMVMLPSMVQAALMVVFGAIVLLLLWRRDEAVADVERNDTRRLRQAAEGIAVMAAIWIAVQAIGAVQLILLWMRGSGDFGSIYSGAIVAAVALSIACAARTVKLVGREHLRPAISPLAIVLLIVSLTVGMGGPYLLARFILRGLGD